MIRRNQVFFDKVVGVTYGGGDNSGEDMGAEGLVDSEGGEGSESASGSN